MKESVCCARKKVFQSLNWKMTVGLLTQPSRNGSPQAPPGVDKIKVIARYFGVTVDYILGLTDIPTPADELIGDDDIISIQRARSKMVGGDRQKMMQMLRIGFEYAFKDDNQ